MEITKISAATFAGSGRGRPAYSRCLVASNFT